MSNPQTWPDEIKWVYVLCNPEKEKDRFERLIPHLIHRGIPKSRIRVCGPTWGDDLENSLIFKVYDPFLPRGNLPTFSYKSARLSKGEVSLVLNFYAAMKSAAEDVGSDSVIVFESDVYLRRDFVERLNKTLAVAKEKPWNYISLGDGVGIRPPGAPKSVYGAAKVYDPPNTWVFRCTDSMILKGDFVQKLSKTLFPFRESLDWEMNFHALLNGYKALWADPPLAEQGTVCGRQESELK
jgi:hypothetical protein